GRQVTAGGPVGAGQGGVDDDPVAARRPPVGSLGEAVLALGTLHGPRALAGGDAQLSPRPGPRLEFELGPIAGGARPGPFDEPHQFLAEGAQFVLPDVVEHELLVALADLDRL